MQKNGKNTELEAKRHGFKFQLLLYLLTPKFHNYKMGVVICLSEDYNKISS